MARVIVFASGKGGTGKTAVVANLGTALAQLGKKTIVLDADVAMANLGLMLGLEGEKITLHDVLSGKKRARRAIYQGPAGLKVVPCGMSLEGIEGVKLERLKKVVSDLAAGANFLLIDSPSGLGYDSITTLGTAKEAILVVTPDLVSVLEAMKVKRVAESIPVKLSGLVINRVSGDRRELPQREIELILELQVLGAVPEDIEVKRAATLGESVVLHSPKSPASKAFKKLAATLLESETRAKVKRTRQILNSIKPG